MFQRDYIMRQIELLTAALIQVLQLRKSGQVEAAEQKVHEVSTALLGVDIHLLDILPARELVKLMRSGEQLDSGKCLIAAELLAEAATIESLRGDLSTSMARRQRALLLFLEAQLEGDLPDAVKLTEKIDLLISQLSETRQPLEIEKRCFRYYETTGRFADAENILFDMLQTGEVQMVPAGLSFYRRLAELPEAEVRAGGLSPSEVVQGMADLLKLTGVIDQ